LTIAKPSGIIETVMAASKQTNAIPKRNKDIPWEEFLASHPPGKILPIFQIATEKAKGVSLASFTIMHVVLIANTGHFRNYAVIG
jgi:hypothetical protein